MAKKRIPIPPLAEQSELIDRLDGPTKLAAALTRRIPADPVTQQMVSNWRKRGIPYRFRAAIAIEANERDIGVPANFLGEPSADTAAPTEAPFL